MTLHLHRLHRNHQDIEEPPVTIEGSTTADDAVTLQISFAGEFWRKVEAFIDEKLGPLIAHEKEEAIAMLVEYGAPEEGPHRVFSTQEKFAISGEQSSLHFRQFDVFRHNRSIAIGLKVHLDSNRLLKKKLVELKGVEAVPRDEWDSWDERTVNQLYERYVFAK